MKNKTIKQNKHVKNLKYDIQEEQEKYKEYYYNELDDEISSKKRKLKKFKQEYH